MIKYLLKFLIKIVVLIVAGLLALIGVAMGVAMLFLFFKGVLGMALCFLGAGLNFGEMFIVLIQGVGGIVAIIGVFVIGYILLEMVMEWLD